MCEMSNKRTNSHVNVRKVSDLDCKVQNLLREATEARNFAYAPYSNFQVGASVLCEDGTVYRGCNVENNSFTVGICAERCAYAKAISEGKQKFRAVAVIAQQEKYFTMPCGACRQFMSEFGDVDVYISKPELKEVFVIRLSDLLPHHFQTTDNAFL